jgi:hypothetical protein
MKEKRVEVRLSLPVVAPLLDVVKELADRLKHTLASKPEMPDADLDFRDVWNAELLAAQNQDVNALLGLFNEDFFTEGIVAFDQSNAEAIARACSAVRLHLRDRHLKEMGDETLEIGEVDLATLPESVRKAFMCYLFLATIQELIIQHLDESIIGS